MGTKNGPSSLNAKREVTRGLLKVVAPELHLKRGPRVRGWEGSSCKGSNMWQSHKGAVGQLQGIGLAAAGLMGTLPYPQWEAPGGRGDIQACLGDVAGLVPNYAIKGVA